MSDPFNVLEYICMIEESISLLYREYARLFPEYSAFWLDLSGEEQTHAALIVEMILEFERGALTVQAQHADAAEYQQLLQRVANRVHEAKVNAVTIQEALRFACDLELSYVEQYLTDIFATDSEDLKYALDTLSVDTRRHQQQLAAMIDGYVHDL